jgi:hypothetical protein
MICFSQSGLKAEFQRRHPGYVPLPVRVERDPELGWAYMCLRQLRKFERELEHFNKCGRFAMAKRKGKKDRKPRGPGY